MVLLVHHEHLALLLDKLYILRVPRQLYPLASALYLRIVLQLLLQVCTGGIMPCDASWQSGLIPSLDQ